MSIGSRRSEPARAGARSPMLAVVATVAILSACMPARPATPRPPMLASAIDAIIDSPPFHRAQWGILFVDASTGRLLYARDPERLFVPASNAKLATAATALQELGPEFRYRTRIYATAGPEDSVAAGLLVRASGDPSMSERFQAGSYAVMDSLADSLVVAGIRRITGAVVVDASYFVGEAIRPSWEVGDIGQPYAPPTGAFGVEEATVQVAVRPGGTPGESGLVDTAPVPGLVDIDNRVRTGPIGSPIELTFERGPVGSELIVSGSVPAGGDSVVVRTVAVPDPNEHAARALLAALRSRGITAAHAVVLPDSAEAWALAGSSAGSQPVLVATWTSPALGEILRALLKESQNWIAEQVTKTVGAEVGGEGSWEAGLEAQRRFLIDVVDIDSAAFVLRDGSGLSTKNLLAPAAAVALLDHARRAPWDDAFLAGLPIAGTDGTLETRLAPLRGRVYAKTGTLTHVNALSGYGWTLTGREALFSIVTNASGRPAAEMRDAMDRVVELVLTGDTVTQ